MLIVYFTTFIPAGLALSFAISITQSINWSVRMASDLESQMVSVERVKTYSLMPQEPARRTMRDPKKVHHFHYILSYKCLKQKKSLYYSIALARAWWYKVRSSFNAVPPRASLRAEEYESQS